MSLLSQQPSASPDAVKTFGNQDATIIDAKPTVSRKFFETEYGTQTPKLDANGNKIPKWDWLVTFRGDDGKIAKCYYSGLTPPDASGEHDIKKGGDTRKFLTQWCEFTGTPEKALVALSQVIGSRVRVMGVPPQGKAQRWKLLLVGPAQNATAPLFPTLNAPAVAAAPVAPVVDGAAAYAALPPEIAAGLKSAIGKIPDAQAASALKQGGYVRDDATAAAIVAHAKTLGA